MTTTTDWRPIETAPQNTPVLVYSNKDMVTAYLDNGFTHSRWQLVQCGGYASDADVDGIPTHWMPLPEPPNVESI